MRSPGALSNICLSLLATSFTASIQALPVRSLVLTPDNFDSTVASGYWFIEHFSPYCGHCKQFAPTWEKLIERVEETPSLNVQLAQVNCATNGDLCDAHHVTGYPQLDIYHNGESISQFKGSRELERLVSYLTENTAPAPQTEKVEAESITTEHSLPTDTPRVLLNPSGQVQVLNPVNFESNLAEGPTFVKFFAPWCGHCKKLAPTWVQLAGHMRGKMNVAEVDCDNHKSLCKAQKIEGYPTLVFFNNGVRTEYNGGRKFDKLQEFAEKATAPALQELPLDQINARLSESNAIFLLLHSGSDPQVLKEIGDASGALLGSTPVIASSSSELFVKFSVPTAYEWVILAIKQQAVAARYYGKNKLTPLTHSQADLKTWLFKHYLPVSLELTQDTFKQVMNAPHEPQVVIAAVTKDNRDLVSGKIQEVGKKWLARNKADDETASAIFTWMDAEKWASWMSSMYGIKASSGGMRDPPIIIAKHGKLIYWDQNPTGQPIKLSSTDIFTTIDAIVAGKLRPMRSENLIERFARTVSNIMVAIEDYIVEHTMRVILFVAVGAVVFIFALQKFVSVDTLGGEYGQLKKSGRVD